MEILTTDYQLWHKSVITINRTTSQGITTKRWHVNKFTHEYKTSSNQTEFMYYHKVVVVFSKTALSTTYFLHVENTMAQVGSDLRVYPTSFNKYWKLYSISTTLIKAKVRKKSPKSKNCTNIIIVDTGAIKRHTGILKS